MLHIDFTLPESCPTLEQLIEEYGLQPHSCSDDRARGKARLTYRHQGAIVPRHLLAACKKVFGKDCSVTTDKSDEACEEYTAPAESDILEALGRVLYIRDSGNWRKTIDRFAKKWGLALSNGHLVAGAGAREHADTSTEVLTAIDAHTKEECGSSQIDAEVVENVRSDALSNTIDIIPGAENRTFPPSQTSDPEDQTLGEYDHPQQLSPDSGDNQTPIGRGSQHFNWTDMLSHCPLAAEFELGAAYGHKITWGIMTNYVQIDGGHQRFLGGLDRRCDGSEKMRSKWLYDLRRARELGYKPTGCDKFCPHAEDCSHGKNMLGQVFRPGQVRILQESGSEMSLEAARELTRVYVQDALDSADDAIHLIIIPTGVGKTEAILNVKNALVAAPTHALASRNADRMRAAGNDTCVLGDVPAYSPVFDAMLAHYHDTGAHSAASSLIQSEIAALKSNAKNLTARERALMEYDKALRWLYETKLTANATHARALNLRRDGIRDTIIFDEDPLISAMGFAQADMSDLLTIKSKAVQECKDRLVRDTLVKLVETVETAKNGDFEDVPSMYCAKFSQLAEFVVKHCPEVQTNVLGLFEARKFVRVRPLRKDVVAYAKTPKLPCGKVIVLSATANPELYRLAFPNRKIVVRRIERIQQVGSVAQCCQFSLSKQQLKRLGTEGMDRIISAIAKKVGSRPVITRKDLKADLEAAGMNVQAIMHFGKCSGFDDLNGQDIAVVGSYQLNPIAYLLVASVLGIHFTVADQQMHYTQIEHEGMLFYAHRYDSLELRMIQLWMVQSELMQAVGRARHLGSEANVLVFASLPISGARFFDLDLAA